MHRLRVVAIGLIIMWAVGLSAQQSPGAKPGMDLIGLWGSEVTLGPQVRGTVTIQREGASFTLRIDGFESRGDKTVDGLRFVLPGGQGELRAPAAFESDEVRGFWIQPSGNLGQFASPVAFDRVGPDTWKGTVAPLEERFSLYLSIQAQLDGSMRGVFSCGTRSRSHDRHHGGQLQRVRRLEDVS